MKKVNLFLISFVTLVTLSIGFSACGGGGNGAGTYKVNRGDVIIYELYSDKTAEISITPENNPGYTKKFRTSWINSYIGGDFCIEVVHPYGEWYFPRVFRDGYAYSDEGTAASKSDGVKVTKIK